MTIPAVFPLH